MDIHKKFFLPMYLFRHPAITPKNHQRIEINSDPGSIELEWYSSVNDIGQSMYR